MYSQTHHQSLWICHHFRIMSVDLSVNSLIVRNRIDNDVDDLNEVRSRQRSFTNLTGVVIFT
jgi:hypothetical protein